MENKHRESLFFNYSDIFFSYYFNNDTSCAHMSQNHSMSYVYSGEMVLQEKDREVVVRKGECVFIRRDNRVVIHKRPVGDEQYRGIFMMFTRRFLREFFRKLEKPAVPHEAAPLERSVIKLPKTPEIESLFRAMVPYFDPSIKPREEFMQLKLAEGVYSLLQVNERFFPVLFDFNEPWKMDILEFLNENYMYDLSMEQIAHFTGRSLSTFKRDFKKISDLSPQKWLIRKRLNVAFGKIREAHLPVTEVYAEVGFKNLSHFSTAFKKQFGVSPTEV